MEIIIFVLILLSFFHFIYESILLPSFRLRLRYKLFSLRDDLRHIKIENDQKINDKIFSFLQSSINNVINSLHLINFQMLYMLTKAVKKDESLSRKVEDINKELENCNSNSILRIRYKLSKYFAFALIINSGGWFIYLFPFFLVLLLSNYLKMLIKNVVFVPSNELKKLNIEECYV